MFWIRKKKIISSTCTGGHELQYKRKDKVLISITMHKMSRYLKRNIVHQYTSLCKFVPKYSNTFGRDSNIQPCHAYYSTLEHILRLLTSLFHFKFHLNCYREKVEYFSTTFILVTANTNANPLSSCNFLASSIKKMSWFFFYYYFRHDIQVLHRGLGLQVSS